MSDGFPEGSNLVQYGPKVDHATYVTVYESIGGWKAMMVWWNPEGFWEPWQTGVPCETKEEAIADAKWWAADEGLEYKDP